MAKTLPAVLVTGASSGIGAVYADRFARRRHDLVLVARDKASVETTAARLDGCFNRRLAGDLTKDGDLAKVEKRLREDDKIGVLINNAGSVRSRRIANADLSVLDGLIRLNVAAVTLLSGAVAPRFVAQGEGAIVNIASVLALVPQFAPGIYSATKSFVLTLSQSLQAELGPKGVYVQAVLPSATRTDIWAKSGRTAENKEHQGYDGGR